MGVILDTSVWVAIERGLVHPREVHALIGDMPIFCAPPIIAELQFGVEKAPSAGARVRRASALDKVKEKPCLRIDHETGAVFGRLAALLDKAGRPSSHKTQDLWIAALAVQHNVAVLTHNRKDFDGIPGVKLLIMTTGKRGK